jgi:serine protease Do
MKRLTRQLRLFAVALVLLLAVVPAASAATALPAPATTKAPTLEERMAALEARVQLLERAMALSAINVVRRVDEVAPSVVSIYLVDNDDHVQSQGTGFVVDADGVILTNAHVVEENYKVKVKFAGGKVLTAQRLLIDPFLDLAVLQVTATGLPALPLATKKPKVGEPLVVIGNAWGYSNSVTMGIVSGVDRPDPYHYHHYPSLQTDAAINHGNSGGPILNAAGEVVAMASWTELKDETDSIAFGIPIDQVEASLAQYQKGRGIVRPWLGASVREPYWSRGGLTNTDGLLVTGTNLLGAASTAGLRRTDWVTKVNGVPVNYLLELRRELEKYHPGDTITVTVDRPNAAGSQWTTVELKVKLGEYSAVVPALVPTEYDDTTDDLF